MMIPSPLSPDPPVREGEPNRALYEQQMYEQAKLIMEIQAAASTIERIHPVVTPLLNRGRAVAQEASRADRAEPGASRREVLVKITFYGRTGNKTSSGTWPQEGQTIATDPRYIPTGSTVIMGGREYIAEDTGSAVKGWMVDKYVDVPEEDTYLLGVKYERVRVIE